MRPWALGALIALGALTFPLLSSGRTAACGPTLSIVPSASPGQAYSALVSVDAVSPSLAWAGGNWRAAGTNSSDRALFERWDGSAWVAIKGRNVSSGDNYLSDVGIVSAKSVWAVGGAALAKKSKVLVEHWTPGGVTVVKSPSPTSSVLTGLEVISGRNMWAVGIRDLTGPGRPLIEHWNGKEWAVVAAPGPVGSTLRAIDALSASDIWAVGRVLKNGVSKTLIEHWNGKSWKVVPSPSRGTTPNHLTAVDAIASNNVWAVGYILGPNNSYATNLIEHWNGSSWQVVGSPSGGAFLNLLAGVASVSANDVWAVGISAAQPETPSGYKTMVLHWNGAAWTLVSSPSPSPPDGYNVLAGVAALHSGQVWAVGDYRAETKFDTLVLNRCG
ncbi:MAG: hypothetical protein H0W87_03165 [Actinobacteria bacterium]|nr:hypothetical protein [Actinomycetota bacterium]